MEDALTIYIPGNIRGVLNRTAEELARDIRLYAALMFFRLGKLSSGAAAEMAGVPRVMFFDLCADYEIPISQITPEELRQEVTHGYIAASVRYLVTVVSRAYRTNGFATSFI